MAGNETMATQRDRVTTMIASYAGGRAHLGLLAAARCGIGVAALARPSTALRLSGVDRVTAERTAWTARLIGGRDLALGAGLLHAVARRGQPSGWLWAGLFSDAVDAVTLATAAARRQVSPPIAAFAVLAATGGVAVAAPALRPAATRTASPATPDDPA
jgi:hypothetical protein